MAQPRYDGPTVTLAPVATIRADLLGDPRLERDRRPRLSPRAARTALLAASLAAVLAAGVVAALTVTEPLPQRPVGSAHVLYRGPTAVLEGDVDYLRGSFAVTGRAGGLPVDLLGTAGQTWASEAFLPMGKQYRHRGNDEGVPVGTGLARLVREDPGLLPATLRRSSTPVRRTGTGRVGGVRTTRLAFALPATRLGGDPTDGTARATLDVDDQGRTRRAVFELGPAGGAVERVELDWSRFGEPVAVSPPAEEVVAEVGEDPYSGAAGGSPGLDRTCARMRALLGAGRGQTLDEVRDVLHFCPPS